MNQLDNFFVSVAVPRPLQSTYTYQVPKDLINKIQLGSWVQVPFGRATTQAVVLDFPNQEQVKSLQVKKWKEVISVLSSDLILSEEIFSLCKWAHEYYFSPIGEVFSAAMPLASNRLQKLKKDPKPIKRTFCGTRSIQLTNDQIKAVEYLVDVKKNNLHPVALLKGVTGSGKTEVYIELAKQVLAEGKSVIILVPEIALTPQLHQRFEESLNQSVALWHSAMSLSKRRDTFESLRTGVVRILVGARSGVFAPVKNLGLMIIDEEHDSTYKQEDRVKYHARDLAIVRSMKANAMVLLGSATPSLETQERVNQNRYHIVELKRKISNSPENKIIKINLTNQECIPNVKTLLATETIEKIKECLAEQNQVVVYLNKRGYSSFLLCKECGYVKKCPNCSVSMTLHKKEKHLKCHVCAFKKAILDQCPKCLGYQLEGMGSGTESLEEDLKSIIPELKIARLDRDQITSVTRLQKMLDSFRNKETNLLLGTQMLVKGHDFPNVTLVVIILADSLFYWPDFRSTERAYQILKQVSGRAGRGEKSGQVLVQTFNPEHDALKALEGTISEQDFWENERELRQAFMYPPFGRIARIRIESDQREKVTFQAQSLCEKLMLQPDLKKGIQNQQFSILGPSEAFIEKVSKKYRWDLMIKSSNISLLQISLHYARNICVKNEWSFILDVDPYNL